MAKQNEKLKNLEYEFNNLPDEKLWDFEREIVRISLRTEEENLLPLLTDILNNTDLSDKIRYAAFCVIQTYYRRSRNKDLESFCGKYESIFNNHPSAMHFKLLKYIDMRKKISEDILKEAEESAKAMDWSVGAWHMLADLTAHYYEENPDASEKNPKEFDYWMEKAMAGANFAVNSTGYAKFYWTLGRLQALKKDYNSAINNILTAINKEKSNRDDYPMRITMYTNDKLRIESLIREDKLKSNINKDIEKIKEETIKELNNINQRELQKVFNRNLEFLSLFAGIITLVISVINISISASKFSFIGAAGLIIIMMGVLIGAFVIISMLLNRQERTGYSKCICILIIALALGLALCFLAQCQVLTKSQASAAQMQETQTTNFAE